MRLIGSTLCVLTIGTLLRLTGQAPAGPGPVQMTAAQDHQRMMDALHITRIPPGPRSGCPETYDEATANPFPVLPDPLTMKSGKKVTTAAMWKERRAEILEDFEREIYGRRPKNIPKVTWTVTSTTDSTSGDIPTVVKQLVGHVDNSAAPAINVDIQATLTTPKNASGPVPVMLIFSGAGFGFPAPPRAGGVPAAVPARGPAAPPTPCDNATARAYFSVHPDGPPPAPAAARGAGAPGGFGRGAGATPPAPCSTGPCPQLLARGWGYATFNTGSVQADNGGGLTSGIIGLVNKGQPRKPDDWGVLSAWAWGASRVLDYFETDKAVDAKMVGLEGHSRWGKATIVAMAFDERFAIAYVSSSGEGGAKLHRRKYGELVQNVAATNEYHWMAENHTKYASDWNAMPVDSHELIALAAPRPVFISAGKGPNANPDGTVKLNEDGSAEAINDAWVDAKGSFLAAAGASPVYKLLGARPLSTTEFPPIETLVDGDIAFRQHSGGHTDAPNWPTFLNMMARYVKKK